MSKQLTIHVQGAVTVTVPDDFDREKDLIPIKLDVFTADEIEDSCVEEVHETETLAIDIVSEVDV